MQAVLLCVQNFSCSSCQKASSRCYMGLYPNDCSHAFPLMARMYAAGWLAASSNNKLQLLWHSFDACGQRWAGVEVLLTFICTDAKAPPACRQLNPSKLQSNAQWPTWHQHAAATKLTLPSISTGMMKSGLGTGLKEECTRVSSRSSTRHCLRRFAAS